MADVAYFPSGWRQVDGTIGSLSALEKTTVSEGVRRAQEHGKPAVLFDSGIVSGRAVMSSRLSRWVLFL